MGVGDTQFRPRTWTKRSVPSVQGYAYHISYELINKITSFRSDAKTLQKYYNSTNFKKMLEKSMLIVYNLYVLKEKCIKNEKKAQNITKIKSCMIGKE